jgi:hypothetical protein
VPATVSALDVKLRNMEAKDSRYRPRWKFTDELCLAAYVQHLENEKRSAEASINTSLARIAELGKNNQGLSGKETEAVRQVVCARELVSVYVRAWGLVVCGWCVVE